MDTTPEQGLHEHGNGTCRIRKWIRLVLLALCLALPALAAPAELRVAVMPFQCGGTQEMEDVGPALQAMIITDLVGVPSLRILERSRIQDILGELELGQSGFVDPKTAAKAGKLLGATHLLTGTCTVVSGRMRIDGRLFAVQNGEVLLAEKIEGEKEAFFELEKALVNKLIATMGVKLAPKERAEVSKVHTADYEAFRKFGRGIRLHDEKKYDQAIAALREAMSRDKDFRLAALTLDEYQRVIMQIQNRAEDILSAQRVLDRAKRDKAAAAEWSLLEQLQAIASGKGSREERLTAYHSLAIALGNLGSRQNKLYNLRRIEDHFSLARNADAAAARYVAEALAAFPLAPLTVEESNYNFGLTEKPEDFAKEFPYAIKKLLRQGDIEENRKSLIINSTRYVNQTASLLHMDRRQAVAFHQQLFNLSLKLAPGEYHIHEQKEALAKEWREVLELDKSTALFTELSRDGDNPYRLKGLAKEIEENRDLAQLLAQSPTPDVMREYLLLSSHASTGSAKRLFGTESNLSPTALAELTRLRSWPHRGSLLLGDQPVWALAGDYFLRTGPRSDQLRTEELRYFKRANASERDPDALLVLGSAPRKEFRLSLKLDFSRPADFRFAREKDETTSDPERPLPSLLFAMRDIDCEKQEDPETRKSRIVRPMRALALALTPTGLRLLQLTELERDQWGRKSRFEEKLLGSSNADLGKSSFEVSIRVAGKNLQVDLNGKIHSFTLPEEPPGFVGLRIGGKGYVALSKLRIQANR